MARASPRRSDQCRARGCPEGIAQNGSSRGVRRLTFRPAGWRCDAAHPPSRVDAPPEAPPVLLAASRGPSGVMLLARSGPVQVPRRQASGLWAGTGLDRLIPQELHTAPPVPRGNCQIKRVSHVATCTAHTNRAPRPIDRKKASGRSRWRPRAESSGGSRRCVGPCSVTAGERNFSRGSRSAVRGSSGLSAPSGLRLFECGWCF